jgi:hypothetical protein
LTATPRPAPWRGLFSDFVGGDAGIPNIAELDRDILRG